MYLELLIYTCMETWSLVNKVASYMLGFASAHSNAEVSTYTGMRLLRR